MIIDGSTQPGYAGAPVIEINGNAIAGGGSGFRLRGGGSTMRGLAIGGFGDHGIWLDNLGSNEVYGNYVGVDLTGTACTSNGTGGIADRRPNNIVGTDGAGRSQRHCRQLVLRACSSARVGNRVEGNYIGIDVTGSAAIPQIIGVCDLRRGGHGQHRRRQRHFRPTQQGVSVDRPGQHDREERDRPQRRRQRRAAEHPRRVHHRRRSTTG